MALRFTFVAALFASTIAASPAHADWYRATSNHFVVYADESEADIRDYTTKLEQFDQAIRAWHMAPQDRRGASARVTVFLLDNTGEIGRLNGNSSVAGFYIPRAGQSVAFTPKSGSGDLGSRAILFHEYTHHWMLTNWTDAALPPWFVEGFAELHATAQFRGDQLIFGAVPRYRKYTIGDMNAMPMSRMLKFDLGKLSGLETDALYSHGWALTHYLTFDPQGRERLAAYIGALNSGKAGDASKLIDDGTNMDVKIDAYVRRPRLPSAAIDLSKLNIGKVETTKLSEPEAATMPALIASQRGVSDKTAQNVAALARRVAAQYPTSAFAQNELAEAEFDLCSTDKDVKPDCYLRSSAAADRAITADPTSIHALVYRGDAEAAMLKAQKVTDPARWAAVRQWYLRANKLATEMPQPLIAYYDSFADAGETPTGNAQSALLYAYALAPYDSSLRLKATRVFLTQGKLAEARTAIAPVAYSVDDRPSGSYFRPILAAIDAHDAAAALKAFDKKPTDDEKDKQP